MKRIIYLLTAIIVLSILITGCGDNSSGSSDKTVGATDATAVEANSASDFEYSEDDIGNIVINRYVGTDSEVVIPQTINGKTVTEIGRYSFAYNKK